MKFLFTFILTSLTSFSFSQLQFEKTEIDFGNLTNETQHYIDIEVKNIGQRKEYFLSFRKPQELIVLSKGESILKDSTTFIRVQVNPLQKGRFSYECEIFTSDKDLATKIKVKGNLTEIPENISAYLACPDFNAKPTSRNTNNKLSVRTLDATTNKETSAEVFILQNGTDVKQIKTKNGTWKGQIPLGFTYFFAKAESYISLDTGTYVNVNRNEIILKLKKDPGYCLPVPKDSLKLKPEIIKDTIREIEVKVDEKNEQEMRKEFSSTLNNETPTQADTNKILEYTSLPLDNFDTAYFKPINVVFLLDVSSSMIGHEKFDLLKFSLIQLLDILRPQDKIAMVSYASDTEVILPSCSGSEKEKVLAEIKKLKASGKTAGTKGIKLGFKVAEKNFIKNGTNMVVVLTDGAFNQNEGDYLSIIEKHKNEGILFSVVGIKNFPKDEVNMKEAASRGNGAYVPVFKLADAQQNVIQEIKRVTFKK